MHIIMHFMQKYCIVSVHGDVKPLQFFTEPVNGYKYDDLNTPYLILLLPIIIQPVNTPTSCQSRRSSDPTKGVG